MEYDPSLTAAYLAGKVDEYVKQRARDTIALNAERDANARYARVPDGGACDFCKMLGSRGFVYHSEEKAGSVGHGTRFDTYHPFCNCQIAVSFDPFLDTYWKNGVKVRRGYADDGEVVVTGRDGSDVLRDVDIDALFEGYLAVGREFASKSRYMDHAGRSQGWSSDVFGSLADMELYLKESETLDQLRERCEVVEAEFGKTGLSKDRWDELVAYVAKLKKRLS